MRPSAQEAHSLVEWEGKENSIWTDIHVNDWDRILFQHERGRILEIGSFDGGTTELLSHMFHQVVAVDPNLRPALAATVQRRDNIDYHQGTLFSVLEKLRGTKFDVIYVDGSHIARDALLDMMMAWELLEVGGLMICDDYGWVDDEHTRKIFPDEYDKRFSRGEFVQYFNVRAAVDAFEMANGEAVTIEKGREWAVFSKAVSFKDDVCYAAGLKAVEAGEGAGDFIYSDEDKQAHLGASIEE